jgi:flagellar basal body L-ring protein FlgH
MKRKKIIIPGKEKYQNLSEDQKTKMINDTLISLRRSYLAHTKNNRALQAKMAHFSKMFNTKVKDDDKESYIMYHIFSDRWSK